MLGSITNLMGLLMLVGGALVLIVGTLIVKRGFRPSLRPLSGYETLFSQIGQALESGGRVHFSLGPNSIIGTDTGTTLAGAAMLDVVSEVSAITDLSPIASTADATTLPLASDTIRRAYRRRDTLDKYEATAGRLVALDAIGLAGGATSIIADDKVRANVLIGSFGPEVALMAEAGVRQHIPQIIGSDRLESQAVAYAMADHTLIGEEIFAARAYLTKEAATTASLVMQDVLRWIVIGLIVVGAIQQSLGLLR